jgi:hypothetical protein
LKTLPNGPATQSLIISNLGEDGVHTHPHARSPTKSSPIPVAPESGLVARDEV